MTHELLRAAIAFAGLMIFVVPGVAIVSAVPDLRRKPLAVRVAWGYLFGVAWIAGGAYVASHLFGVPLKRTLFLSLSCGPVLVSLVRWIVGNREPARRAPRRRRLGALTGASVAFAGLVCAGLYAEALRNPVSDWDGRMTWFSQARFVREERTVDARAIREDRWYLTNRRYPLLLPLAQVAVQETLNLSDDERAVRPLYATYFPVFLVLLGATGAALAGRRAATLAVLAATSTPFFAFWNHGGAAGGYSDFPLACFLGAGAILLLRGRSLISGLGAGLLLGAAVLTKREGAPAAFACLVIVAGVELVLESRKRAPLATAARLGPAAAVVIAATLFFGHWAAGVVADVWDEGYFQSVRNPETWRTFPARLLAAAPTVARETIDLAQWGLFWIAFLTAGILGLRALRRPRVFALAALSAVAPALGLAAYGVHWDPPTLAAVTWSRFLAQSSLFSLLVFTACLGAALRRTPRLERG